MVAETVVVTKTVVQPPDLATLFIPHQAPQRERVSYVLKGKTKKGKTWQDILREIGENRTQTSIANSIPRLLALLEPKVVASHNEDYVPILNKFVGSKFCSGQFFEGWHRLGYKGHGVYEGSYWYLLGALQQLIALLKKLSKAPPLLEEPQKPNELELNLPKWEDFKPALQLAPEQPNLPPLTLPVFRPPLIEGEPILDQPELIQIVEVGDPPKIKPVPPFVAPKAPEIEPFEAPTYVPPKQPQKPTKPQKPIFGKPEFGEDWTGEKPFQIPFPDPVELFEVKQFEFQDPLVPIPEVLDLDEPEDLEADTLEPVPRFEIMFPNHSSSSSSFQDEPIVWLNFDAPLEELPPLVLPPKPEQSPKPEFEPPKNLLEKPPFVEPQLVRVPSLITPTFESPVWQSPCEPKPVGFLRGIAPILILDVSGTMHPNLGGQFIQMKDCVEQLLNPHLGEMAASGLKFDVLTFNTKAFSWSLCLSTKQRLYQSSVNKGSKYSGRQVGGTYPSSKKRNNRPMSAPVMRTESQPQLQLVNEANLKDAQQWVSTWPQAIGNTYLFPALLRCSQYEGADCVYLFSDGLIDDMAAVRTFYRRQTSKPLPVHCVGFIKKGLKENQFMGERHLQEIAKISKGSYQRFNPHEIKQWMDGKWIDFDAHSETQVQKEERIWAEQTLNYLRKKNARLGIQESLFQTIERLREFHEVERVQTARSRYEAKLVQLTNKYNAHKKQIEKQNQEVLENSRKQYDEEVAHIEKHNQLQNQIAHENWQERIGIWEKEFGKKIREWERTVENMKKQSAQRNQQVSAFSTETLDKFNLLDEDVAKKKFLQPEEIFQVDHKNEIKQKELEIEWEKRILQFKRKQQEIRINTKENEYEWQQHHTQVIQKCVDQFIEGVLFGSALTDSVNRYLKNEFQNQFDLVLQENNQKETLHCQEVANYVETNIFYQDSLNEWEVQIQELNQLYTELLNQSKMDYEQEVENAKIEYEKQVAEIQNQHELTKKVAMDNHKILQKKNSC